MAYMGREEVCGREFERVVTVRVLTMKISATRKLKVNAPKEDFKRAISWIIREEHHR